MLRREAPPGEGPVAPRSGALAVSGGDVLAGAFEPARIHAESRDLYAFLYQNDATSWLAPFKSFSRCTLHAVSATGGSPVDMKYHRGLRPRRVLEPLLAILAMKGMIDRPGADRVGW